MIRSLISLNRNVSRRIGTSFPSFFGGPSYYEVLLGSIQKAINSKYEPVVLEVGGVNRPLLQRSSQFHYVGVDIDDQPDCHSLYDRFVVQSVEKTMPVKADIILSITLLEHVANNTSAAKSIFESLNGGGSTHHYVPSKWHPYAICLRIVGPAMQRFLIRHLRPEAVGVSGYPTYFDFCTPKTMKRLFEDWFSRCQGNPLLQGHRLLLLFRPGVHSCSDLREFNLLV